MKSAAVVVALDEIPDVGAQVMTIAVFVGIDLLVLERFHETFATGVVIRITGPPTHARYYSVASERLNVVSASVLDAPIGMVDKARRRLPISNRQF